MQCTEARVQLDQAMQTASPTYAAGLREHLAGCASCRDYADDGRLQRQLQALPVPPLSKGFAERALDKAWQAKVGREAPAGSSTAWRLGIAASLVLAVGIAFKTTPWGPEPLVTELVPDSAVQVVQVAPQSVRQVELLMVSDKALPAAVITVQLDEHVALAGYSGISKLRWQSPISAGNNQLSLPVQLLGDQGGVIVVEVESDGARKRMTFAVQPAAGGPLSTI
jgi:hypothetical protein